MNFSWNLLRRPIRPDEGRKPTACASTSGTDPDAIRCVETTTSGIKAEKGSSYIPKQFDVWAMAMTTVVGGLMYGWNAGLSIGFGGFLVAQTLMGFAFIILVYALSEIVSTTSFSGGSYCMARVMLGFYPGFLIACFELMEYMSYSAASVIFLTNYIVDKSGCGPAYEPLIGLMFYVFCFFLLLERDYLYWKFLTIIAVSSVLIILLYCIGSLPFTDFAVNASMHIHNAVDSTGQPVSTDDTPSSTQNWFRGGMVMFLQALPYTSVGFAGIESGALITEIIDEPRKNMPAGLNAGVLTLFVLFIAVNFVASSLSPGLSSIFLDDDSNSLMHNTYFMNYGLSHLGISADVAEALILPAQLGMAFTFLLPSAKLYQAMVESKLFLNFFPLKVEEEERKDCEEHAVMSEPERQRLSKVSTVVTMLISYFIYLIAVYYPAIDIVNIPVVLACIVYLSDLFAYYKLQTEYNTIDREFKSPFGIIGAIYAAIMFLLCFIAMIGFLGEPHLSMFLAGFFVVCSLYYFLYASSRQVISPNEQRSVFTLHVIRFNRMKRKRVTKKRRSLGKKGFKKLLALLPHS